MCKSYSSFFLRREATAAESAASPVPKSTTVIGSGIGTGPDGGGVDVDVGTGVGASVTIVVGVSEGTGVDVGVKVGPSGVLVGVNVSVGVSVGPAVFVGVKVGGSVASVSVTAGASCANAELDVSQPGKEIIATKNKIIAKTTSCIDEVRFIVGFSPHGSVIRTFQEILIKSIKCLCIAQTYYNYIILTTLVKQIHKAIG